MNTNEAVEVTQADREAAAAVLDIHYMGTWNTDDHRAGLCDNGEHVQAFARHRIASIAAARPLIMEEAAQLAHSWPSHALTYDEPPLFRDGARWAGIHIATAIRAAKTDGAAHDR